MNIVIVICQFPPFKGGMGNMAYSYALGLVKKGHKVRVITLDYSKDDSRETYPFEVIRLKPLIKYGFAGFVPQIFKYLKDFEIINLHYPFFGAAECVWLYKKIKGDKIKLIINYHMDVFGQNLLRPFFYSYAKFLLPKIVGAGDKIIATSMDYVKESLAKKVFNKNPERFIEIPPAIDIEFFKPAPKKSELLQKYGISETDKVLIFVGGLDSQHYFKGVEYLIRGVKVLYNSFKSVQPTYQIKVLIVGKGNLLEEYKKLVKELNLENIIIFAGFVPDQDLPDHYNLADAAILPSIDSSEAFGIVLAEAMSCGKPVIASNMPGLRVVVDRNKTGLLIDRQNEGDLASTINYLFSNPELMAEFGQNSRGKVLNKYRAEIVINKLEQTILN